MAVTQAQLSAYRAQVGAYGDAAGTFVREYVSAIMAQGDGLSVADVRDEAIEAIKDALNAFGDQAASVALDLLEDLAASHGVSVITSIEDVIDDSMIDGGVRYAARNLLVGNTTGFTESVSSLTRYYVSRSAFENMAANCERNDLRYARVPSGLETCAFCFMLSSRGFVYRTAQTAGEGHAYHANCVLPETNLGAVGVRAGLRRKYEGPICHISTRGGRHLSVTPNHPILTVRGWVDAGHLKDGDALLCARRGDGHEVGVPYVDDAPARADEVFEALRLLLDSFGHGVPATAVHLDGEPVPDGDVEIVDVDRLLEGNVVTRGHERLGDEALPFARALDRRVGLTGSRCLDQGGDGNAPSTRGLVGGRCLRCPLLWGHLGSPKNAGLRGVSDGATSLGEPSVHDASADSVNLGKLEHARSVLVSLNDSGRCGEPLASRLDTVAAQNPENGSPAYTELFSDFACLHSGGVEVDYVSVVRHSDFVGHVYNLSTEGSWYFANDIIVHNCDCVIVPGFEGLDWDSQVEGYSPTEMYKRWKSCADTIGADANTMDADELKVIRREVATRDFRWLNTGETSKITVETGAKPQAKEVNLASILSEHGFEVNFLKPSNTAGSRTADATLNGVKWEFKQPTGDTKAGTIGKNTIDHQFEAAVGQSRSLVVDATLIETYESVDFTSVCESASSLLAGKWAESFDQVLVVGSSGIRRYGNA